MKCLIAKTTEPGKTIDNDEFMQALLEFRNTPREAGMSPAQILFGQSLRSCVPVHRKSFDKVWLSKMNEFDRKNANIKERVQNNYINSAKELSKLKIEDSVIVQDTLNKRWDKTGKIVGIGRRRDYTVIFPSGILAWRNRKFFKKFND